MTLVHEPSRERIGTPRPAERQVLTPAEAFSARILVAHSYTDKLTYSFILR